MLRRRKGDFQRKKEGGILDSHAPSLILSTGNGGGGKGRCWFYQEAGLGVERELWIQIHGREGRLQLIGG